MTVGKARRTRIVMLMIPVRLESGLRTRAVTRRAGSTALVDAGGGFPRQSAGPLCGGLWYDDSVHQSPLQQPRITDAASRATVSRELGGDPTIPCKPEISTKRIFQSLRTTTDPSPDHESTLAEPFDRSCLVQSLRPARQSKRTSGSSWKAPSPRAPWCPRCNGSRRNRDDQPRSGRSLRPWLPLPRRSPRLPPRHIPCGKSPRVTWPAGFGDSADVLTLLQPAIPSTTARTARPRRALRCFLALLMR